MVAHFSILAWRSHGQSSLAGYSPWGQKELDTTEQLELLLFTYFSSAFSVFNNPIHILGNLKSYIFIISRFWRLVQNQGINRAMMSQKTLWEDS